MKKLIDIIGRPFSYDALARLYQGAAFLLPFYRLPGPFRIGCWASAGLRKEVVLIFLFVGGGFMTVYPRSDYHHLIYAIPELLIGGMYLWRQVENRISTRTRTAFKTFGSSWLFAGFLLLFVLPVKRISGKELEISKFPHFRAIFIEKSLKKKISSYQVNFKKNSKGCATVFY
jgi:hypothetical protein